ncbi:LLM class oxidoreductase [Nocardia cyriacigeorgica]|uniref:LLM class oxidoreductase n=1 Tax=Nocardia cyriacigeorgica TaxID=135487 RepID=UPI00189615F4|nr:LLM class oxidoreductase [Nocardia cyriacigeorgica]MBF6346336.1 LLM class oxidoreductase [Nocardia cyriacigeorgica]MBF6518346.1 LLM class oxidoreductase [Nocardia cyriacigeorgica]
MSNRAGLRAGGGETAVVGPDHPGFGRMFDPGRLTVGLFLPLWRYTGDMAAMAGQGEIITRADTSDFAAIWVRDVPLADPQFGDVGQVYDPWTYLAWLAAHTDRLSLAAGSAIFSLRHPIDLAKQAASIDQLSGGRLVLGAASGDRASEFPAYGIDHASRGARYRETVQWFRALTESRSPRLDNGLGRLAGGVDMHPKPVSGRIPLLVTGSSQQQPEWIAEHADGWLVYPGESHTAAGPAALGRKVAAWRTLIPGGQFKPVATNEWIDLTEDPGTQPTPLRGGFVLRTGSEGLIELLGRWQEVGINHAALGVQHGARPAAEAVQQLIEEVAPHFPAIAGPQPHPPAW